jgi:hypothetical protein
MSLSSMLYAQVSQVFPSGILTEILDAFLIHLMNANISNHLPVLDLMTLMFGEE